MINELMNTLKDLVEDIELLGEEGVEANDSLLDDLLIAIENAANKHRDLKVYKESVEEYVRRIEEE